MAQPDESGIQKDSKRRKPTPKKRLMLEALTKHFGNVRAASDEVDMNRATHYDWLRLDSEYAKAVDDLNEAFLDIAEEQLMHNIKAGKEASLIFYLKNRGKKRGYFPDAYHVVNAMQVDGRQAMAPPSVILEAPEGYDPNEDLSLSQ